MVNDSIFNPGQQCGDRYDIVRLLARRAVVESYLAIHIESRDEVVVTCSRFEHIEGDAPSEDAFNAWVMKRHRLSPEGLPAVYGCGVDEGVYWLAEEHIDAPTAFDATRRPDARSSSRERLILDSMAVFISITNMMDEAADAGILHGDLTPDCILIDGLPQTFATMLLRLGHAQLFMLDARSRREDPRYQAPEALAGGAIDARSDIYSLGMIMHSIIAREPPFAEKEPEDAAALLALAEGAMPRPLEETGFCPPCVSEFIAKAVAKDPDERFQSWEEAKDAFGDITAKTLAHPRIAAVLQAEVRRLKAASMDLPAARPAPRAVEPSAAPTTVPPGPETKVKIAIATRKLRARVNAPKPPRKASKLSQPDAPTAIPQPIEQPRAEPPSHTPRSPAPWTPAPRAQARPARHKESTAGEIHTTQHGQTPPGSLECDEPSPVTLPSTVPKRIDAPASVLSDEHRMDARPAAPKRAPSAPFARFRVASISSHRGAFVLAALLTTGLLALAVAGPGSRQEGRAFAHGARLTFESLPVPVPVPVPMPMPVWEPAPHPPPRQPAAAYTPPIPSSAQAVRVAPTEPVPSAMTQPAPVMRGGPLCGTVVYCFEHP